MALNDLLDGARILSYNNPKREFVLFMEDHMQYLLKTSTTYYPDVNAQEIFRYRPHDYLREIGIRPELTWYVLWINQIRTTMEFTNIRKLIIPSMDAIKDLYSRYKNMMSFMVGKKSAYID